MENANQKKQSPHTKKLNIGDRVRYVLDVGPGPMERSGGSFQAGRRRSTARDERGQGRKRKGKPVDVDVVSVRENRW